MSVRKHLQRLVLMLANLAALLMAAGAGWKPKH